MKALFLTVFFTLSITNIYANEVQRVCVFSVECWVEMTQEDNKELVETINVINNKGLDLSRSQEAQGNVWFKAYKRQAKYSPKSLKPSSLDESEVRALLDNGMKFFAGSDYEDMLRRYDMGSDFHTDIIKFFSAIKFYSVDSLNDPLNLEVYDYDYSRDEDDNKVKFLQSELSLVSNFIEEQAKSDKWSSLVTVDFTNALYNENYEYRPYLLITKEYVVAALYRWQL